MKSFFFNAFTHKYRKKHNSLIKMESHSIFALLFLLVSTFFFVPPASANQYLEFVVENETYFKNLEHTSIDQFNEGQTFFGDILKSYFRYTPIERVTIEAGVLLGVPFGNDKKLDPKEPIISAHLDLNPWLRLTAGTLNRQHLLPDAFFNDDLAYTDPIEQGVQLLVKTKRLSQDTWVNWEIKETSTRREKLSVGNYSRFNYHGFMLEGLLYWVHYGGQRNNENGVINNLSLGAGTGFSLYPKKWSRNFKFLDEVGITLHYLSNRHTLETPTTANPETDGNGILGKVFVKFRDGAELYYQQWDSDDNNFKPAKGDPLYKATDYKEVGIERTWLIGEGISLTASIKGQWVEGNFVHIDFLSVNWRGIFPLFEDYFRKIKK